METRILLIEDDTSTASALLDVLANEGYAVETIERGEQGLARAVAIPFDLVLTDLKLPGLNGLQLTERLHAAKPRLPIILMTAHGTTETAIQATKLGAYEYLIKPFEAEELLDVVAAALAHSRLMSEPVEIGSPDSLGCAVVGRSKVMQKVYKEIGRVAGTPATVLIRGATGTGKELVARALYQHSQRSSNPFIAVNCAAIPETLLESELFGHERGSFTGAHSRRIGRFEQANAGTIFLDEIGDLNPNTQSKLLRVLQERCIQRLGGDETLPVDVRVLAATHRDLEAAIAEREFREDLFYRLSVVTIRLPALCDRREDIPDLIKFFIRRYAKEFGAETASIQPESVSFLQSQAWPGNVRELENVIRQALLLARPFAITLDHVKRVLATSQTPPPLFSHAHAAYIRELLGRVQRGEERDALARMIAEMEPELYAQAIRLADGNQAKAARWLGVTRLKMREKLQQFGLRHSHTEPES